MLKFPFLGDDGYLLRVNQGIIHAQKRPAPTGRQPSTQTTTQNKRRFFSQRLSGIRNGTVLAPAVLAVAELRSICSQLFKGYLWKTTALILLQQAPTGASSAEFNIMRKFLRSFCGESAFSPTRHSRNEAFCACVILLSLRVTPNKKYKLSILDE